MRAAYGHWFAQKMQRPSAKCFSCDALLDGPRWFDSRFNCPCCFFFFFFAFWRAARRWVSPCAFTKEYIPALIVVGIIHIQQSHHLCGGYVPVGDYSSLGHRWAGCFLGSLGCRCWWSRGRRVFLTAWIYGMRRGNCCCFWTDRSFLDCRSPWLVFRELFRGVVVRWECTML